jgi:monothiol glutaredoxin
MTEITAEMDAHTVIANAIGTHPIVLFMKGSPAQPQCGFSATVVALLQNYDVPVHSVDVLDDPAIRRAIKTYSNWPTIPQLYVNGDFVGGCDIVCEMHESGELAELLGGCRVQARPSCW